MSSAPIELVSNLGPDWTRRRVAFVAGTFDKRIGTGEDFDTRALGELFQMEPDAKPKMEGPAFIPSTYADHDAREHKVQKLRGEYVALTCDIDKGDWSLSRIESLIRAFCGDAAWLIYSSPHSRPGDRRWRAIVPLHTPADFDLWCDAQYALFGFFGSAGVVTDRALARAGQLVFLPNVPETHLKSGTRLRGQDGKPLYFVRQTTGTNAPGLLLTEGAAAAGIAEIRRKRAEDDAERERLRMEAQKLRAQREASGAQTADIISDFNRDNSIATLLQGYGYEQSPRNSDDWKSTYQTGDTFATRVLGDKWVSLSQSDTDAGIGARHDLGCYGDAYDLFVHYEFQGDHKAAFRQLYKERKDAQGTPSPPEWMNEIPTYDEAPDWLGQDEGEPVFEVPEPETAEESDTFPLLSLAELAALPPPSWLIDGIVSDSGLSILYGDPGSGKSFVTIDMAMRLALGWDWHGAQTKRVGVLYIAGEGVRGLGNRIKGWRLKHGVADDADIPFALMPVAAQLLIPEERARLLRTIDAAKVKLGFDIGLIVIDTVSRSIAGQDENGQETMSAFVKGCDEIRDHCGGAVIGVHHSGKDKEKGMRGSTVLLGACDATFKVQKADSLVTLKCEKQKDGEEAQPIYLKMERFAWSVHGEEKEQSTLIPIVTQAQSVGSGGLTMEQVRGAFAILTDAWMANKPLSHKPQTKADGRYAPVIFSKRLGGDVDVWVSHIAGWLETGCVSFDEFDKRAKKYGLNVVEPIR